jgi:amino acid adenylation domain-containing protein
MNSAEWGSHLPAFIDAELTRERTYWSQKLAGEFRASGPPPDFERPATFVEEKSLCEVEVELETQAKLLKLSGHRPALAFAVLIAALKICLYKYTGAEDVVVGTPIHEDFSEVASLNKVLALLDRLHDELSVKELLVNVKQTLAEAYEHQKYPFNRILDLLELPFPTNRAPLFDVVVTLANINNKEHLRHLKYDISFDFSITDAGLKAAVEYNTTLFRRGTIEKLAEHYARVLRAVVDSPGARISEIELLSAEEKRRLLFDFNSTEREYPRVGVHQLFEAQVERTPDSVALVYGTERVTYQQLNERANQLARYLRARGVGVESLVGICLERSIEMVVGLLAVLKAGAAYVPLDPSYPESRLRRILEDGAVRLVLTEEELAGKLDAGLREAQACLVCLGSAREEIGRESAEDFEGGAGSENLAYVIYTSGSTGHPKGVMISHGSLTNHMCWMLDAFPLGPADRVLQKTPFSFDAAVWEFYAPLLSGAQLVLARPGSHLDSRALVEQMIEQQVSVLQAVPTLLQMLVEEPELESCRWLRRVFCGGEAFTTHLARRLTERVNVEVVNLYGPTETTIECGYFRAVEGEAGRTVPIGRPIANMQMYVLDRRRRVLPVGIAGELYVSGAGLARGYLNRPALTAEKFQPHPFLGGGARLYRTGDLARHLDGGQIEFLGRVDEQVKLRGYRIELGEIEAMLQEHPSVRESVVLMREDETGDKQLVAYVVCRRREPPTTSQLREFLKERLPEHMLHLTFVLLDKMPLTTSGKIDRRMLPDPKSLGPSAAETYVAPRNEVERIVTNIWQEVLKVERIGVNDNFFDLGGHSLLMFQIQGKLRQAFQTDLSTIDLFKYPSISLLTERLSLEKIEPPSFQPERERARKQREAIRRQRRPLAEPGGARLNE